jgi:molybdopterin-biosynthesis enzyme MoeA-like protein
MAGVPAIMQAMLDAVGPTLATGQKIASVTLDAHGLPEGVYANGLAGVAAAHPAVSIGSYPSFTSAGIKNQIVLRSRDERALAHAAAAVETLLQKLKADAASV